MCHCGLPCLVVNHETAAGLGAVPGAELMRPPPTTTVRNLLADGRVRLSLGPTRDVVVDGTAEPVDIADLAPKTCDAFATKTGFDPRELNEPYQYFLIRPRRIQAWREANELRGRDLMRDGRWLG